MFQYLLCNQILDWIFDRAILLIVMYCTIPIGCDFFAPIQFAKDPSGTVLVRRRLLLFSSYMRDFVVHRYFLGLSFLCHVNMPQKMVDPPVNCALAWLVMLASCRHFFFVMSAPIVGKRPTASLLSQSLFIEIHTQT
jgi:hypothetical protein